MEQRENRETGRAARMHLRTCNGDAVRAARGKCALLVSALLLVLLLLLVSALLLVLVRLRLLLVRLLLVRLLCS